MHKRHLFGQELLLQVQASAKTQGKHYNKCYESYLKIRIGAQRGGIQVSI